MTRTRLFILSFILLLTAMVIPVHAEVDTTILNTLKLTSTPLDFDVSKRGQRVYVLDNNNTLLIFNKNGSLQDSLPVPSGVSQIIVGAKDDLLYLMNPKENFVQILRLSFIYTIDIQGSPFKGRADAPVTIVVFSDFQCPYCSKIEGVLNQVLNEYPGKIKIVFKNFPLGNHKFAQKAAQAAMAAHEQGKFWEFNNLIFKNLRQLNDKKMNEFASSLKLDKVAFGKDRFSEKIRKKVLADRDEGIRIGVTSTPSVFVNGALVRPANLKGIKRVVAKELGVKTP